MAPHHLQVATTLMFLFCTLAYLPMTIAELDQAHCPTEVSGANTVYSPFTPWWTYYSGSDQQCWSWASCVFLRADESRKQQFSATALVMGLIPLTFKDIAWPGRRLILLSQPLPSYLEVCVRTLGMEPRTPKSNHEESDVNELVKAWWLESQLATWTWKQAGLACSISFACLLIASMALVLAELYSKRSSLGCVYPVFVLTWFIVAFIPASAHTFFSKLRRRKEQKKIRRIFGNDVGEPRNVATIVSAVQGAEEWWIVQLFWAVFYIAGTLIVSVQLDFVRVRTLANDQISTLQSWQLQSLNCSYGC